MSETVTRMLRLRAVAPGVSGSQRALLSGRRIDTACERGNPERIFECDRRIVSHRRRQPVHRLNNGNGTAPGVAAAGIDRRRIGVVVIAALCEITLSDGMRMSARRMIRVAMRRRGMVVILHRRTSVARPAACGEGQRDGNSQNDR